MFSFLNIPNSHNKIRRAGSEEEFPSDIPEENDAV
jgi:hypothetical protein